MKKLLFLCTGNYYRSRFSEEYFNHHCRQNNLPWLADSMGIQRDFTGNGNVGPIAEQTLAKLTEVGIEPVGHERMPKHVQAEHFDEFDRVIAVSLDEHKAMLADIWPEDVYQKVEFFEVEDLHIYHHEVAFPRLIASLDKLLLELS
ncbi:low molecular weight phosphatase family protein [Agaribacterium haliotis]|uniref:arsenate-mycothiol transferase ArsC n=1 Tax=Agaribacterium haliotis TaxID=2013869 RepID=UPI000BB537C8|nr:low molecular weight phosphatase family protein [Agaribacterium haliotis]